MSSQAIVRLASRFTASRLTALRLTALRLTALRLTALRLTALRLAARHGLASPRLSGLRSPGCGQLGRDGPIYRNEPDCAAKARNSPPSLRG
jgi:hypothetical protein